MKKYKTSNINLQFEKYKMAAEKTKVHTSQKPHNKHSKTSSNQVVVRQI